MPAASMLVFLKKVHDSIACWRIIDRHGRFTRFGDTACIYGVSGRRTKVPSTRNLVYNFLLSPCFCFQGLLLVFFNVLP